MAERFCPSCMCTNIGNSPNCTNCGLPLPGAGNTVELNLKSPEEIEREFRKNFSGDGTQMFYDEIRELQEVIKKEIAEEDVDVELSRKTGPSKSSLFSEPGAIRKIMAGRTEKDVLDDFNGLADNIFFELRNSSFILGYMEKELPRGEEREWMSDGLLMVIQKIEVNRKVPHQDFDWWAVIKRVKFLLEENKVKGPLKMISEDLFVLEGKVEKLRFKIPSVAK